MLWGYDVSQYQPHFDHFRAKREGFEFCGLRGVGSNNNPDTSFHRHLRDARNAGIIVIGAYLFVNDKFSAAAQADTWLRHVPHDVPLIIDSEPTPWSGSVAKSQEIVDRVRHAGRKVSLVYMGDNMSNILGNPNIRGLGTGLWKPRYPDNRGGTASQIYQRVPGHYWNGHGGFPETSILQYSQAGSIAGNTPTDCNAFRGTREDLLALIGGEDDLDAYERNLLFDCLEEATGNRVPGQFPGFPNIANGARLTMVDAARWADARASQARGEVLAAMAAEGAQDSVLEGLIDALDSDFDPEPFYAKVREAARKAVEGVEATYSEGE